MYIVSYNNTYSSNNLFSRHKLPPNPHITPSASLPGLCTPPPSAAHPPLPHLSPVHPEQREPEITAASKQSYWTQEEITLVSN